MKSKVFSADTQGAIIKAVNDWLAGESGIAVRHSETSEADAGTGAPRLRFEVWYDQDAQ